MYDYSNKTDNNDNDEKSQYNEQERLNNVMDKKYGPRTSNYDLRPRRERSYNHLFTTDSTPLNTDQISMRQGIALFGDVGIPVVKADLLQLYNRNMASPIKASTLYIYDRSMLWDT
jgi:hypothetical protein